MPPESIWLLGAGRLGRRAAESLRNRYPDAAITLIDSSPEACAQMEGRSFAVICREGIGVLSEGLKAGRGPDWIVPMIPVHVAYAWMRLRLADTHRIEALAVPPEIVASLPNPMRGAGGRIYASNATFRCPWNCPEPEGVCTHTGKPRPANLYAILENVQHPQFRTVVVRSLQLAPGVGGYRSASLFNMLSQIAGMDGRVLLSTACRCHGVMDAFRIRL